MSTHMGENNYFKCHYSNARYYFATDCTHNVEPAARRVRAGRREGGLAELPRAPRARSFFGAMAAFT